jgi:hypothetical protein
MKALGERKEYEELALAGAALEELGGPPRSPPMRDWLSSVGGGVAGISSVLLATAPAGWPPALPAAEPQRRIEDHAKILALEERVRKLEARLADLAAQREPSEQDGEEASTDAFSRWIEEHIDELRRHPDTWILLDPEKGIVFHTTDEAAFSAALENVPREERDHLMPFNTRMYI